jgi:anaerobic ribonucleoside-triphosphate reductase
LLPAVLPDSESSERLARLDVDRYGLGKVRFSGTREKPFYSTISKLVLQDSQFSSESLTIAKKLQTLCAGGSLTAIDLGKIERKPEELVSLTKQVVENCNLGLFTYDRELTYCINCKKSWLGLLHKCPSCGAISTLLVYNRYGSS